jgi:hypothetical protein
VDALFFSVEPMGGEMRRQQKRVAWTTEAAGWNALALQDWYTYCSG